MLEQILAILIFLIMFILIIFDKIERHLVTLAGALLMIVLVFGLVMQSEEAIIETLNFQSMFKPGFWYGKDSGSSGGMNWSVIIFIAGMMIMLEGMGRTGFFRWICLRLARMFNYRTMPLYMVFMSLAGLLAMFIESTTVILFLAPVTFELARLLKFNPVPLIVAEIFCANLGGAATMCGDPPNIIIGLAFGYNFFDFLKNTGLIAGICFVIVLGYFYLFFRKETKRCDACRDEKMIYPDPAKAITNKKTFISSGLIFLLVIVLKVGHSVFHISVASIGVISAVLTILSTIIFSKKKELIYLIGRVDYKTLLFFGGLFIVVDGLERTNVLDMFAKRLGALGGNNIALLIIILLWISAVASSFVDNIPFAASMVPVIRAISLTEGVPLETLSWTLAMGTDIGGSATPVGASTNIVGTSIAAREKHPISWGTYCKYATPITAIVLTISTISILVRYIY